METNIKKYVIYTYAAFWGAIVAIGVAMLLIQSKPLVTGLQILSSWTPAMVFSLMFHKIYPNEKFFSYFKRQFREKLNMRMILGILGIFTLVVGGSICLTSIFTEISIPEQLVLSPGILISTFFYQLIMGPIGEEFGWRSFVLNQLQEKYSPLKSTRIIWLIWSFWHMPLWFLSGYTGMRLVQYIVCFLAYNLAACIIITACYNLNHNLFIPILLHQLFNYGNNIQKNDILHIITLYAILYSVVAGILVLMNYKNCLSRKFIKK